MGLKNNSMLLTSMWNVMVDSGFDSEKNGSIMYDRQILRTSIPADYTKIPEYELQKIISSRHVLLKTMEPIVAHLAKRLELGDDLALMDTNGVIFLCHSNESRGLRCKEVVYAKVQKKESYKSLESGNPLEISYDDNSKSLVSPIIDQHGHICFYVIIHTSGRHVTNKDWMTLILAYHEIQSKLDQLNMRENCFDSIIHAISEPSIVVDTEFHMYYVNRSAIKLMEIMLDSENKFPDLHFQLENNILRTINTLSQSDLLNITHLVDNNQHTAYQITYKQLIYTPLGVNILLKFQMKQYNDLRTGKKKDSFEKIIGPSLVMQKVISTARRAAKSYATVLINGESGTGKEMLAEAIHQESGRLGKFVAINCGGIPSELLQSELFGYEEGAFTGAKKTGKKGLFEIADKGTLFLDEIGEMPLTMQVALLRFLQDKIITRLGSDQSRTLDVRIIAATNRNLEDEVKKGNFREDLFYRINVINLRLPPIRERRSDIPSISNRMVDNLCQIYNEKSVFIGKTGIESLLRYNYPGNVRELSNVIEREFVLRQGNELLFEDLNTPEDADVSQLDCSTIIKETEKEIIEKCLTDLRWNITHVAKTLNITRQTLYNKMKAYNIKKENDFPQ